MIRLTFLMLVVFLPGMSLLAQVGSNQGKTEKVEVYYFYNERRCPTCIAVEKITKEIVRDLYKGEVEYKVYNLSGERGKEAASRLGIAIQSVLIVKGEKIINLTVDSFRFARNKPEKLKALMKEKIDPLL